MSRVIKSLVALIFFFGFAACSPKPVFTVEVFRSPTPAPLLPIFTATVAAPTEMPTLTASPPAVILPPGFSPVLYGRKYDANTFFTLLGGVQNGAWLTPEQAADYLALASYGWAYDIYTFAEDVFHLHGSVPEYSNTSKEYFIRTEVDFNEFGMVGVVEGWPVLQRDVQELSPDTELYQQVIRDWLAQRGLSDPELSNLQILRVDLEGDGVNEIFISATHLDESQHTTKIGDYSIILMRKVAGNGAVTLPVVGDVYQSTEAELTYPRTYSVGNFIDLNQDGILEVVVDIQRWEGDGAAIYQIDGQDILQVP